MKIKNGALLIGLTAAGLFTGSIAFASTTVVTPSSMDGWTFGTGTSSYTSPGNSGESGQMVSGPATAPLGSGSAQLAIAAGSGDNASFISTSAYNGTRLDQLTALSYYTYDTANNGQQFPYIMLSVSTSGTGLATDYLFFEPPYQTHSSGNSTLPDQGATAMTTWQSWNAKVGGWWNFGGNFTAGTGVNSLDAFLLLYPNATIAQDPFFNGDGLGFYVGEANPAASYNGYLDAVTIGTSAGTTTYDFEPNSRSVPDAGATVMLLGFALAGLSAFRRWKIAS